MDACWSKWILHRGWPDSWMFEAPSAKLKLRTNQSAEAGLTASFDWIGKCTISTIESPGASVLDVGLWGLWLSGR